MATASSNSVEIAAAVRDCAPAALLESLRPGQWVKNGFVFAALIFSHSLTDWHRIALATFAALVFCAASSAMYLVNDVADAGEDRRHPGKRMRPIASGRLGSGLALSAASSLLAIALGTAWRVDGGLFKVVLAYVALNILYSLWLKRVMLIDVLAVAAGFVLRVIGGGVVIHVKLSVWLIVCSTLLALLLALGKRRHELLLLGESASSHRISLGDYTPRVLDQLIGIVSAATVVSYAFYTLSEDVRTEFPGKHLEITIPLVLFGIFRYLYIVHRRKGGGEPARLLFSDAALLSSVLLWAATVVAIIYL